MLAMSLSPEVPDTWTSRDLPVLRAIVAEFETRGASGSETVGAVTGLDRVTLRRSVKALSGAGYMSVHLSGDGRFTVLNIAAEARRQVGAWPSADSLVDRLLAEVERRLAAASTPDERSRLEKMRDGLASAGREVLVGVATAALGGAVS